MGISFDWWAHNQAAVLCGPQDHGVELTGSSDKLQSGALQLGMDIVVAAINKDLATVDPYRLGSLSIFGFKKPHRKV